MPYGYAGNLLIVNLSTRQISQEQTALYTKQFLGGRGIAANNRIS